jgi:hypothetical protein
MMMARTTAGTVVRLAYIRFLAPQVDTGELSIVRGDGHVVLSGRAAALREDQP